MMQTRKEMKKRAKQMVKKHYGIFLAVCLIAAFVGSEFKNSLDFTKQYDSKYEASEELAVEGTVSVGATTGVYQSTALEAVVRAVFGDVEGGKEISDELVNEAVQQTKQGEGNQALGRSRGVLASLVNGVSSGAFVVKAIQAIRNIGVSQNALMAVFIILALLLLIAVWYFLCNMFQVVTRRIFLEGRVYEKVSFQRMLLFVRAKKWGKVSHTMFMTTLLYWLWSLTLIGGVIKKFSYYMVPYIVAENPDIHWRDAITLSRKMMNGHKWECFVFRATFLFWDALGYLTLGISNLFFANQYRMASFAEYYAALRDSAKESNFERSELLNDTYLFEKADRAVLDKAYADIVELEKQPDEEVPLTGISGFLAKVFGITILPRKEEKQYQANEERKLKIEAMKSAIDGTSYPTRLSAIPDTKDGRKEKVHHVQYLRHYSIPSLILLFFIFAFIGWLWEVSLHLVSDGEFVNRGVLHGPWLPIYGSGGVLILIALNKFRKKPVVEFFAAIVLCGFVEYFTAYYLELTHGGQKWWDYSGYFLNLHGRICAEGLTIFGVGGMVIVYVAAPFFDNFLRRIKYRIAIPLCIVLVLIFTGDQIYSKKHPNTGKGITDYKGAAIERQITMDESFQWKDRCL